MEAPKLTIHAKDGLARRMLATAVLAATIGAALIGLNTEVPGNLPGISMNSGDLYRVEVGFFCLAGFYIAILVVALAVYGKGLTKLGKDGAEIGSVIGDVDRPSGSAPAAAGGSAGALEVVHAIEDMARADEQRFSVLEGVVNELRAEVRALRACTPNQAES